MTPEEKKKQTMYMIVIGAFVLLAIGGIVWIAKSAKGK